MIIRKIKFYIFYIVMLCAAVGQGAKAIVPHGPFIGFTVSSQRHDVKKSPKIDVTIQGAQITGDLQVKDGTSPLFEMEAGYLNIFPNGFGIGARLAAAYSYTEYENRQSLSIAGADASDMKVVWRNSYGLRLTINPGYAFGNNFVGIGLGGIFSEFSYEITDIAQANKYTKRKVRFGLSPEITFSTKVGDEWTVRFVGRIDKYHRNEVLMGPTTVYNAGIGLSYSF